VDKESPKKKGSNKPGPKSKKLNDLNVSQNIEYDEL
jgi:hypothetical protein